MENLRLAPDNDEDDLYSGYDYQDNLLDVSDLYVVTAVEVFPIRAHYWKALRLALRYCYVVLVST